MRRIEAPRPETALWRAWGDDVTVLRVSPGRHVQARAATMSRVLAAITDSQLMNSFACLVSGIESVGLNAIEFVIAT